MQTQTCMYEYAHIQQLENSMTCTHTWVILYMYYTMQAVKLVLPVYFLAKFDTS